MANLSDELGGLDPGRLWAQVLLGMALGIAAGIALGPVAPLESIAPAQAKPLLELPGSMQEICITVVRWCMVLAPPAVFGLMAQLCTDRAPGR